MAARKYADDELILEVTRHRAQGKTGEQIANAIGLTLRRLYARLADMGMKLTDFPADGPSHLAPVATPVRSPNLSFDALVADRKETYRRLRDHEDDKAALTIGVPVAGPYGIVFLGDPHVDDDGCDWLELDRDIRLIQQTEGLYAVNLGDTQNNWVGRLERLYANQRTTAAEALILVEGFVKSLRDKWLFHIGGNHDLWSGRNDPLPAICAAAHATYIPVGGKVRIKQGAQYLDINARHNFAGNSMWNPAHGPTRSILMGNTAHVTVCGHKHTTGQGIVKDPNGRICHALQVASYKRIDDYAHEGGFRDNAVAPACMVVVDHRFPDTHPAMATVFHSVERGASYLKFLRGEYEQAEKKQARRR